MREAEIIEKMWGYFTKGLSGTQGACGDLHLDWLNFGRLQGLGTASLHPDVLAVSRWIIDFDARRISFAE